MIRSILAAGLVLGMAVAATVALSQTQPATEGPAAGKTPAWFTQGSFADPGGRTVVTSDEYVTIPRGGRGGAFAACSDDIAKLCPGQVSFGARACLVQNTARLSGQ